MQADTLDIAEGIHDDGLAQMLGQARGDATGHAIGRAAGREGDDGADGAGLCCCGASQDCQSQGEAARDGYRVFSSFTVKEIGRAAAGAKRRVTGIGIGTKTVAVPLGSDLTPGHMKGVKANS